MIAGVGIPVEAKAPAMNGGTQSFSDQFVQANYVALRASGENPRYYSGRNSPDSPDWEEVIRQKAQEAGLSPDKVALIAKCESGFKPWVKNANSTASGLFQYLDSTWQSMSVRYGITTHKNDPYGQIELTIKILADGGWSHWNASISCWGR